MEGAALVAGGEGVEGAAGRAWAPSWRAQELVPRNLQAARTAQQRGAPCERA
jgi:hypothetical protein